MFPCKHFECSELFEIAAIDTYIELSVPFQLPEVKILATMTASVCVCLSVRENFWRIFKKWKPLFLPHFK